MSNILDISRPLPYGSPMSAIHSSTHDGDDRDDRDDDRIPMTTGERASWVALVLTPITVIWYFVVVLPQLSHTPASDIGWQVPMLWSFGVNFFGTIIATILMTIAAGIVAEIRKQVFDTGSDMRDKEIDRAGGRVALAISTFGLLVVLILAMIELDVFWIGNAAFFVGAVGATAGAIVQVRAYRGYFHG